MCMYITCQLCCTIGSTIGKVCVLVLIHNYPQVSIDMNHHTL